MPIHDLKLLAKRWHREGETPDLRLEIRDQADALAERTAALLAQAAWDADTANDPAHWRPERPSYGQCAVTALLIDALLAPTLPNPLDVRIFKTEATQPDGQRIGHYFNVVLGQRVDATEDQFPAGTRVAYDTAAPRRAGYPRTRDYLLANPDTRDRFDRLRLRLSPARIDRALPGADPSLIFDVIEAKRD